MSFPAPGTAVGENYIIQLLVPHSQLHVFLYQLNHRNIMEVSNQSKSFRHWMKFLHDEDRDTGFAIVFAETEIFHPGNQFAG